MRKAFLVIAIAWGLFVATAVPAFWWWQNQISQPLSLSEPVLYELAPGAGSLRLLNDLTQKGYLVASPFALKLHVRTALKDQALKAGHYWLTPAMTFNDVVDTLVQGKQATFSFSIIAGHTFSQVKQLLANAKWINFDLDNPSVMRQLNQQWRTLLIQSNEQYPDINALEGAFLAETYFYHANDDASDILQRAMRAMVRELNEQWQSQSQASSQLESMYEALILASIIEKETGLAEERALISGVFHNRLAQRMRLQTDPTVIYGLGSQFDGNLTRKHLRSPTPYNTYVIKGLPPTPIAMVGREAIRAAMIPQVTEALYFVAKGDGSHQFSETLQQHNEAVYRYQINKESQD